MSEQYRQIMKQRARFIKQRGKHEHNDCGVVSLATACRVTYEEAHEALRRRGRKWGLGTSFAIWRAACNDLGFISILKASEFKGRTIISIGAEMWKRARGRTFLIGTTNHWATFNGAKIADWAQARRHRVTSVQEIIPKQRRTP